MCCFGMMYVELYGACNFVVISAIEGCVDNGGYVYVLFGLILVLFMVLGFVLMYLV